MKLTVEMNMDNDAFILSNEAAWIIRNLSHQLLVLEFDSDAPTGGLLMDANGNAVGEWSVENET